MLTQHKHVYELHVQCKFWLNVLNSYLVKNHKYVGSLNGFIANLKRAGGGVKRAVESTEFSNFANIFWWTL